jgi:hypothetical protein
VNPYRFKLSLRAWHPRLTAAKVCQLIDLRPVISRSVGERRATPKGGLLQGVNSSTYCTFELAKGSDSRLPLALRDSNARLISRTRQIRGFLKSGGTLEYFIGIFTEGNSGLVLEPELIKQVGSLNIRLAFDIYPPRP